MIVIHQKIINKKIFLKQFKIVLFRFIITNNDD